MSQMTIDECAKQFAMARKAWTTTKLQAALDALINAYGPHFHGVTCGGSSPELPELWRVRKVQVRQNFLKDIGPPPLGATRAGRLNDKGTAVFYGANHLGTALLEMDASEGDLIQIGAFRLAANHSIQLGLIGELHHAERTSHSRFPMPGLAGSLKTYLQRAGQDVAEMATFIDAFLASLLFDPAAKRCRYFRTRALGRTLFQRCPSLDGLIYPTVRNVPGFNIALKAESFHKLRLVCCMYAKVMRMREFGVFRVKNIDSSLRVMIPESSPGRPVLQSTVSTTSD